MACPDLNTRPYPACATELTVGTNANGAGARRALVRNVATDRWQEYDATVAGGGAVIVTLAAPLQPGHDYLLELLPASPTSDEPQDIVLDGNTTQRVRLRPRLTYDPAGEVLPGDAYTIAAE
jgi:hypothetical protein